MEKIQVFFVFLLIILLLTACAEAAPGSQEIKSETITVMVFVDENVNGRFDANEPPIPNTLIAAQHNVHGSFTQTAALANDEGTADIQVQLWQDDYQDGAMGDGERPLVDTTVHFNPNLAWTANNDDHVTGLLTAQTDADGIARTSLGNGCSVVWIKPVTNSRFTKIRPSAIYEDGRVGFEYADGLLEVRTGVTDNEIEAEPASVPLHRFTFINGNPHHAEGLGEWQLLLDRGGYLNLKHIVKDTETDYGVITLLPGENEQLWHLIKAADLAAIPTSTGEALPDTITYTFTLNHADENQLLTNWSTEVQEYKAVQELLDGLTEVIRSHTGENIIFR